MKAIICDHLSRLDTSDFFVTVDILSEDKDFPESLDTYIFTKIEAIHSRHIPARKFLFKEGNWKIHLTFFPTQEVVDERYAMKNKMIKTKHRIG